MVDSQLIMQLRQQTGAGIMDCKKALEQADNDFDKAIEILRKSGAVKAAKKQDRQTSEGVVRMNIKDNHKKGAIIKVLCETDFVAKNQDFIDTVDEILKKGFEQDIDKVFNELQQDLVLKVGENIQLGDFVLFEGEYIAGYVHSNNKVGCLVEFSKVLDSSLAKDIAMHIVALKPKYISQQDIPEEVIEKETSIYKQQLLDQGKPENIIEKIIPGKLEKFFEEVCLLNQKFIKDEEKTIKDLLGDVNIVQFKIFTI